MIDYDVVIIGGGPAGCATAIALTNLDVKKILVVESGDYDKRRIGESIPPDTRDLFTRLGIFEAFIQEEHEVCLGSRSCWGSDDLGYNDFLFNPKGCGWHLDRLRFDRFMAGQCKKRKIELITQRQFKSIALKKGNDSYVISLDNDRKICAKFVVDASGRGAKVARRMGAVRREQDNLSCLAAYYNQAHSNVDDELGQMTFLEATEEGWWYSARLPDDCIIVALSTDFSVVKEKNLTIKKNWYEALMRSRYLAKILEKIEIPQQLTSWSAPSSILDSPIGESWAAVGDAASTYDPISSQGIYKALDNALQLASAIVEYLNGSRRLLLKYRQFIGENFLAYLEQRAYFYHSETRWPDSMFWRNRHMH